MMKTLRILTAGVLAVALAACGSDSTGPGVGGGNSQVRADLSGALSGRVDISGNFVDSSKGMVIGVMGTTDGETALVIHATDPHFDDATRPGRGVGLVFLTPQTGTYNTADLCTTGTDDHHRCVLITLTDKSTEGFYALSSGRVTVSKFTSKRITGTFEGQGLGVSGEDVVHFKDGRFDVEILDIGDVSEARASEHPAVHLFDDLR